MPSIQKRRRVASSKLQISLFPLSIPNAIPAKFMEACNNIPLLGYHVESLADGSKVCVTKPGGKTFQDFQVWVQKLDGEAWRPSHREIYNDVEAKCAQDPKAGAEIIKALKQVHAGAEPEEIMKELSPEAKKLPGLLVELILKVYKWIFGQEDCNYPPPKFQGRNMAMDGFDKLLKECEAE